MALLTQSSPPKNWPIIRNILLIAGTYAGGAVSVILVFPLWIWLLVEAALRYFPIWLQIVMFVWLGIQLDWLLNWPLGFGLLGVAGVWLSLIIGRRFTHPAIFILWHLLIFTAFMLLSRQILPNLTAGGLLFQLSLYFVTLIIRLIQGKQT